MATKTVKAVKSIPETQIIDATLEGNKKVAPKTKKIKIVAEKFCDFFEEMAEQRFFPMTQEEVSEMVIEKLNETNVPTSVEEEAQGEEVKEELSKEVKEFLSYEIDELYEFIRLANERLVFLQSNEISEIEAEISRLKERLAVLKGQTDTIKDEMGFPMKEKKKKAFDPIVNPENSNEVYTAGRLPEWVIKLSETTGKTIRQLRGIDD